MASFSDLKTDDYIQLIDLLIVNIGLNALSIVIIPKTDPIRINTAINVLMFLSALFIPNQASL